MQIIIKVLKGAGAKDCRDCTLEVTPTWTILEVKQRIEQMLQIPASNQKLLLFGRPLSDEQSIVSYATIKDGTKLNLVVMRPDSLRDVINRSFRKYYSELQSERATVWFLADFEHKLKQMSLDDIEAFADNVLNGRQPPTTQTTPPAANST